jgi:hypothetical protein
MVCCSLSLTRDAYIAAGVAPPCTATTLAEKRLTGLVGEITWGGPAAGLLKARLDSSTVRQAHKCWYYQFCLCANSRGAS